MKSIVWLSLCPPLAKEVALRPPNRTGDKLLQPKKYSLYLLAKFNDKILLKVKKKRDGKRDKDKELAASLMVACLKRLLPVGLNLFAGREQELVQHAKEKFLKKKQDQDIFDYVKTQLTLPDKIDPSDDMSWQHYLYSKLGTQRVVTGNELVPVDKHSKDPHLAADQLVERIIDMAKVLYGLHMVFN